MAQESGEIRSDGFMTKFRHCLYSADCGGTQLSNHLEAETGRLKLEDSLGFIVNSGSVCGYMVRPKKTENRAGEMT